MTGQRASDAEWQRYYERAEYVHAVWGDPLRRYARRVAMRQRVYVVAIVVYAVALVVAFAALSVT